MYILNVFKFITLESTYRVSFATILINDSVFDRNQCFRSKCVQYCICRDEMLIGRKKQKNCLLGRKKSKKTDLIQRYQLQVTLSKNTQLRGNFPNMQHLHHPNMMVTNQM